MKAKYTSWEDFIKSEFDLLECYPKNFYIEKGRIVFTISSDGVDYYCSGSECYVTDIYFNPETQLKNQCDFDSFYMFEIGNKSNCICNW